MPVLIGRAALLLMALALAQPLSATGLYKWVDEDGNVHYSDQPPPEEAEESAEMIDIDDGYGVKQVAKRRPLPAPPNPPNLVLKKMDLKLSNAESTQVTIGRLFYGRDCKQKVDMHWDEGFLEYSPQHVGPLVGERFKQAGYRFSGINPGFGHLGLQGSIAAVRVDACAPNAGRGRSAGDMHGSVYLRVVWRLVDGAGQVLLTQASEGAYHGWASRRSLEESFLRALEQATDNLLAEEVFRNGVDGVKDLADTATDVELASTGTTVKVAYGDGAAAFVGRASELLAASVTIRLEGGHGSGVFIAEGTVLTNAHVVGDQTEVTVVSDDGESRGQVVARNVRRDVALVKTAHASSPVTIARRAPHPGESLYVIGTPLDESLSHTVTKGILSATRRMDGLSYYQTDASINRGNSGGPVFDDRGELVGISVAGIFTRDGAGMNVNYVIPIESALSTLGIDRE